MHLTNIQFKILDPRIGKEFKKPNYATEGSAGLDLMACVDQELTLSAGETILIPSGISIYIQNPNYAATIIPRSGLGHKHGIILGNSIGLIDSDYQGELKISCWNRSQKDFIITPGMRIAQLVILEIFRPLWQQVDSFASTTRGEQGFGSTGQHNNKLSTDLSTDSA